ncbi:multidrug transporter [Neobacillus sp. KR4-4]|uniref:multidrug transporter n=1 Tax=Neobacillus sp. KR4-4 TaxID=3344872 RepID=UPI0035C949AE
MLKINFNTLLIGVEGTKTPAGVRGRGDPAGAKSAEEALRHAREPLVPGTEINRQV